MKKEKRSFYDFCIQEDHPDLLNEWDTEKNLPLTAQQVSSGSDNRIWWRCGAGHTWQAPVYRRSRGSACPYCSNERILPGYNDLATKAPMLAAEWDLQKNLPLTPNQVMYGSNKKVWWRCAKGHEWQAVIAARYADRFVRSGLLAGASTDQTAGGYISGASASGAAVLPDDLPPYQGKGRF